MSPLSEFCMYNILSIYLDEFDTYQFDMKLVPFQNFVHNKRIPKNDVQVKRLSKSLISDSK